MNRSTANTPTRERILNAAMEVFAARGYHGTVVDTITAASGTSKGAFYHYFPSKQAIFLTLMDELASDVEHGVELVIWSGSCSLRQWVLGQRWRAHAWRSTGGSPASFNVIWTGRPPMVISHRKIPPSPLGRGSAPSTRLSPSG